MSPLSKHEQQILSDLERSFLSDSPKPETFSPEIARGQARRAVYRSLLCFIIGAGTLIASFTQSLFIAMIALAIMLASSLTLAAKLQLMSRASRMMDPKGH